MDNQIKLRAIEPADLEKLYEWENDDRVWFSSATTRPLSRKLLQLYIDSVNDIYTDKQVRLIIEKNGTPVGCLDLFDFEPLHQRAGVGIMIDSDYEGKGFALLALSELQNYAFNQLGLHQLYCSIASGNSRSIALFEKATLNKQELKKNGSE